MRPNDDRGYGNITIPTIGSGHVLVNLHKDRGSIGEYKAEVSDIPGQTRESSHQDITEGIVCGQPIFPTTTTIDISGIGSGTISMKKVN